MEQPQCFMVQMDGTNYAYSFMMQMDEPILPIGPI